MRLELVSSLATATNGQFLSEWSLDLRYYDSRAWLSTELHFTGGREYTTGHQLSSEPHFTRGRERITGRRALFFARME